MFSPQPPPFLRLTAEERHDLKRRLGSACFARRMHEEATRELRMGGAVRWCPMKAVKPLAALFFRVTGLWKRGHREFLDIRLREETFAIEGLDPALEGFTLLHLSDLHLDISPDLPAAIRAAVERARGRYDAAVVTGDFNNFTVHNDARALSLVADLRSAFSAPVYGVLGNHDSLRDVPYLERHGIRMLLNESVRLRRAGAPATAAHVLLAGIDDPNIFRNDDLAAALRGRVPGQPTVLLAHAPSIHERAAAAGVDVVLCGHVHGGQVCLPSGKTVAWRTWNFPRRVWRGRWTEGRTQGYTSTGTGACGVPIRLNCPPEIVLIHLVRTSSEHNPHPNNPS